MIPQVALHKYTIYAKICFMSGSPLTSFRNKRAIQNAQSLESELVDLGVERSGFTELLERMPTLRRAGYLSIESFLGERAIASLSNDPFRETNPLAKSLSQLFFHLGFVDTHNPSGVYNRPAWNVSDGRVGAVKTEFFHTQHVDGFNTHTFLLNPVCPAENPLKYFIYTPAGLLQDTITITPQKLVVLDGEHTENEKGVYETLPHAVHKPDLLDPRLRLMCYTEIAA